MQILYSLTETAASVCFCSRTLSREALTLCPCKKQLKELSEEEGHHDKCQGMTAKSKNHFDREDFYISAGDNCSLVSSLMTFTAVKAIGKDTENFKAVFSLTKTYR